jgi:hypothetical protein
VLVGPTAPGVVAADGYEDASGRRSERGKVHGLSATPSDFSFTAEISSIRRPTYIWQPRL